MTTINLTASLRSLDLVARVQNPTWPAGGLAQIPAPGFTHQCGGNSLRVFWTLTLSTNEPALAPGAPGALQLADQALLTRGWQHVHRTGLGNQLG